MNKIRYSTNWMGPVSMKWYQERGLVETKMVTLEHDSMITNRKAGDQYVIEEITTQYSCGRIDVMGTDDPFGTEIGVPPMLSTDWARFSNWLDDFNSDKLLSLCQLVELYEKSNPKITWNER